MNTFKDNITIISLGGSVLVPDKVNTELIIKLKNLIASLATKQKIKFIIVIGGGKPARIYQDIAKHINPALKRHQLDKIGIAATRFNAELIRAVFGNLCTADIVHNKKSLKRPSDKITILSGWEPGRSTDTIAVEAAKKLHIKTVIMAGKPDHVYDRDFTKFKKAKPFTSISWEKYRKLIPSSWLPGMPSPIDPVAARIAQENDIDAIVISGKNIKNLRSLLSGKKFKGTIVSNK